MNDVLQLFFAFTLGIILGGLFFAGLWFTVKKAVQSTIPLVWFGLSFLIRVFILLFGFYSISHTSYPKLIACLLGFITARIIILRMTKSYDERQTKLKKEEVHHET
ncbi:ATP synthase subunit I [Flavobacterium sp. WC2430]|uniref:N-ATPase subunit AtpR n=1 Tax=Flavobacterium sp. WC2430 TaxID=3234137 RepID=UPI003465C95B